VMLRTSGNVWENRPWSSTCGGAWADWPWTTLADRAELDLLAFEFVRTVEAHRKGCSICSAGGPWCDPLRECFDGIIDWRRFRELRSLGGYLRELEEARAA
jgi:hypothetical protein